MGEDKLGQLTNAIASGRNLRVINLNVDWIPGGPGSTSPFTIQHAMEWMLQRGVVEGWRSRLREIVLNDVAYTVS